MTFLLYALLHLVKVVDVQPFSNKLLKHFLWNSNHIIHHWTEKFENLLQLEGILRNTTLMFSVCCHPEIFYHGNMTYHFLLTTNTVIYHNWLNLHWPNNTFSNVLIDLTFDCRTNWLFDGCLLWNGRPRKRVIYLCLTHQKPHDTEWKTGHFHRPMICPLFLPQTKLPWWDL